MSKRTYYRGPDAVVTDQLFIWQNTPTRNFAVRDLRNVGQVRADAAPASPVGVAIVGGAIVAGIATGWTMIEPPTFYAIGLLVVLMPLAFAVPSLFRRRTAWELHATYRGVEVVLYSCTEERQFNQVKRALRRAMENARPPAGDLKLAAA